MHGFCFSLSSYLEAHLYENNCLISAKSANALKRIASRAVVVTLALRFYRKTSDVESDMDEMDTEHLVGSKDKEQEEAFTWKHLFHSPDLRRPLLIACFLQVAQQFSGINAVSHRPVVSLDENQIQ